MANLLPATVESRTADRAVAKLADGTNVDASAVEGLEVGDPATFMIRPERMHLRVGDAAGFMDPIFSAGVSSAASQRAGPMTATSRASARCAASQVAMISGPTPAGSPQVMAILNVTPDSFSDGGNYCVDNKLSLDLCRQRVERKR